MQNAAKDKFNPKINYAICEARIVTIYNGKRTVLPYKSGQRLKGRLPERNDGML